MTSDTLGKLTISIKTKKLELEQDPISGFLAPTHRMKREGPGDQTTLVLSITGLKHENAESIVQMWREANPNIPHKAVWEGPTPL